MKIVIDISESIYNELSAQVASGAYSSLSLFVQVAIENQLCLQSAKEGPILDTSNQTISPLGSSSNPPDFRIKHNPRVIPQEMPSFSDINVFNMLDDRNILIWGQINKIFPVKSVLRTLVNLLDDRQEIDFETFRQTAVEQGKQIGMYLQNIDSVRKTRRDERLSIAFPIGKEQGNLEGQIKSDKRFASQYAGYVRKNGKMSGALFEMRFANISSTNGGVTVGLTGPGLDFAQIPNPVLDGDDTNHTLSSEETRFYIDHCTKNLPGELTAMKAICRFISEGSGSRISLNNSIRKMIQDWKKWKSEADLESFVNTQRGGLISRLYEMHLIDKIRKGNTVTYSITPLGQELLTN